MLLYICLIPQSLTMTMSLQQKLSTIFLICAINFLYADAACGRSMASQIRVVGGKNAQEGAWPWMAGIYRHLYGQWGNHCGGALISPTWILTAAHCFDQVTSPSQYGEYKIVLGDTDRTQYTGREQSFSIVEMILHKGWNDKTFDNDIALLRIDRPALLNSYVKTVCLPSKNDEPTIGKECYVTGWGIDGVPGKNPIVLQQAVLPIITNSYCQIAQRFPTITKNMLCAGHGASERQMACHGDSGGPFVCKQPSGNWVIQGVVSFGPASCSSSSGMSVFARVTEYLDWIKDNMNITPAL